MIKSLIIAMTPSGVIGRSGKMPWHLPEDLKRFKRLTMGKPVIMGRRTFESLSKPLTGRLNIVVSRNDNYSVPDGVQLADSVLEAWIQAEQSGASEAVCIGGAEIYHQCLSSCDRAYLTVLGQEFEGDTYFREGFQDWEIINREYIDDSPIPHQNLTLERVKLPMSTKWLTLERMEKNDLPQPRYATTHAAGIDFAACLTRPCFLVEAGTGAKREFKVTERYRSWKSAGAILSDPFSSIKSKATVDYDNLADHNAILVIDPGETVMIPLGWKCSFGNTVFLAIHVRSSIGLRGLVLANGTGVVDSDYRGELLAVVRNVSNAKIEIKHGERVVQGILTHFSQAIVREGVVDETMRGAGGFGSTGIMAAEVGPQT